MKFKKVPLLILLLSCLGLALFFFSPRGVFLIDENKYLVTVIALRHGTLNLPGTEGLKWSPELEYFDPNRYGRPTQITPIPTSAPPLYAFFALPFSFFGWPGLVALNIISFLASAAMVFLYSRRFAKNPVTPWLSMFVYLVGAYSIEYAQGMWPQMLSAALCMGAMLSACIAREESKPKMVWAVLSGFLIACATGIRYQNLLLAGCIGLGIFFWAKQRFKMSAGYALGVAGPLATLSIINHLRVGWFNPVKGHRGYLTLTHPNAPKDILGRVLEVLGAFLAKVVDFSFHEPMEGQTGTWMHKVPETGAFLYLGAIKKAWLQSAPWLSLSLVGLGLAWYKKLDITDERKRELKALSINVAAVLALFSLVGFKRNDGLCFNQRYFLDLMPAMAVVLGWMVEPIDLKRLWIFLGICSGLVVTIPILLLNPTDELKQILMMKLPLVLAALLTIAWIAMRSNRGPILISFLLGVSIAWAAAVHLGDDVVVSRNIRNLNQERYEAVLKVLPDSPSAVFAHWVNKDGLGPLQLDHDVVIADTWIDNGASAPELVEDLLQVKRKVFVLLSHFPDPILRNMLKNRHYRLVAQKPFAIIEIDS